MYFLYDLAVRISAIALYIPALFLPKIRRFVRGRKNLWQELEAFLEPGRKRLWMHTASLGEFEQGLPVLEQLQRKYPEYQFLVTFFSPSGYDVKKGRLPGAGIFYLPLDTRTNARRFVRLVQPQAALFVKYEVWPNFFRTLNSSGVPIILFSALFHSGQAYFKWYGSLLRRSLLKASAIYVQDEASLKQLQGLGYRKAVKCGDTRLDRVAQIAETQAPLDFMETFKGNRKCLVAGSTWPDDEKAILPFLNEFLPEDCCVVIAPHQVDPDTVFKLEAGLKQPAVRYSELEGADLQEATVLIADTIGLLTRIYKYADLAYVGGGFRTGLHNTLEPAVYGIPVIIGPHYDRFREARDLVDTGGLLSIQTPEDFSKLVRDLLSKPEARTKIGALNRAYIQRNRGASQQIVEGIAQYL